MMHPLKASPAGWAFKYAYVVTLMLYDDPNCETWERGRRAIKADIRAGATYLYDMKNDVRFIINKPFHALHFYLPRAALDFIAEQSSAPRVGELPAQLGAGHDDPVIRHIGEALLQALRRPAEINELFIDYAMLAFTTHAAQTYGGLRTHPRAGSRRSRPMAGEARLRTTGRGPPRNGFVATARD